MVKGRVALECKSKLARMVRILTEKRKGHLSCGLHRAIHAHDLLSATILS